ncbi:MAG TPA: SPOR domain-containing protein, partial [Thermoanaerobaculia bacterium]|nr:SPOR domain-containing protein [Thermoanaerobaculia bacterium]
RGRQIGRGARRPAKPQPAGPTAYVVQVLVTKDLAKAQQVLAQLRGGGYPASMANLEQGGATLYRVRVGPFADKARAQKIGEEMKTRYKLEAWVRTDTP